MNEIEKISQPSLLSGVSDNNTLRKGRVLIQRFFSAPDILSSLPNPLSSPKRTIEKSKGGEENQTKADSNTTSSVREHLKKIGELDIHMQIINIEPTEEAYCEFYDNCLNQLEKINNYFLNAEAHQSHSLIKEKEEFDKSYKEIKEDIKSREREQRKKFGFTNYRELSLKILLVCKKYEEKFNLKPQLSKKKEDVNSTSSKN